MTATVLGIADGGAFGGSLRVVVTRPQSLGTARAAVEEIVASMDEAASRFRQDSELSVLNSRPDRVTKISPLFAHAIEVALRAAEVTGGAVNPTVGAAVRLSGYDADFSSVALVGGPMRLVANRVPGWRAIRFSSAARTVLIPSGVELDLGATAKALTADLAAAAALRAVGGGVLVSLGGDISVGGEPPPGGWPVQVSEDSAATISDTEETISINSGGLATSGTSVRYWLRGGVEMHHIVDPTTGQPAAGCWRTATVAAGGCADANIASTAAIVMGDAAVDWLENHRLAARLVSRDGAVHRTSRWPLPDDSKRIPTIL